MSDSIECPRCRRPAVGATQIRGRGFGRCPDCGTELIRAVRPTEANVRNYLYGHRLASMASVTGVKARAK